MALFRALLGSLSACLLDRTAAICICRAQPAGCNSRCGTVARACRHHMDPLGIPWFHFYCPLRDSGAAMARWRHCIALHWPRHAANPKGCAKLPSLGSMLTSLAPPPRALPFSFLSCPFPCFDCPFFFFFSFSFLWLVLGAMDVHLVTPGCPSTCRGCAPAGPARKGQPCGAQQIGQTGGAAHQEAQDCPCVVGVSARRWRLCIGCLSLVP